MEPIPDEAKKEMGVEASAEPEVNPDGVIVKAIAEVKVRAHKMTASFEAADRDAARQFAGIAEQAIEKLRSKLSELDTSSAEVFRVEAKRLQRDTLSHLTGLSIKGQTELKRRRLKDN